ncbi:hypothetical protein IW146_005957 [Coemansia sp. RSA 922]|nr:hypothetical protein H4S03_009062 [Coemansia sp. S3946]KAJ2036753.1 hypothetical protein H4S04_008717 [Coemansia sp. S16]KAJ2110323.1 hypothetical protein IW146_005957 [Coemansia sp. RSA 922]KAJ2343198.1 hypothetical protein GGH92_005034 [Coemansia sp. RSA 2673]
MLQDSQVETLLSIIHDWLDGQGFYACKIRKLPMVYEHGHEHYYVVWETGCPTNGYSLEWWTDDVLPGDGSSTSYHFVKAQYKMIDKSHHRYSVIIGPVGLATKVHYRTTSHSKATAQYSITRRNETELTRVLVIADNQNGPAEFRKVLSSVRKHYGSNNVPDAILHVGDSLQNTNKLSDWQNQLFSPLEDGGGFQHRSPTVFVPGNHDHDKARTPNNSNLYTDMYHGVLTTYGLGDPVVVNGTYHRFFHTASLGSARVIVLDSECPSAEQSEFLERELQSEAFQSAQFRIVAVHVPPYIEFWDPYTWSERGEKHWGEHIRLEYDPLFRRHNVDLVISGHQHNYQRGTVQRDPQSADSGSITYAIVGGAGGGLDLERVENWYMYNVTYLDHHFVSLEVDNRQLRWLAKNKAGTVIDQFNIVR